MRLLLGGLVSAVLGGVAAPKASAPAADPKVDVDPDRVVEANVRAAATLYRAAVLEELQFFRVVDRIAQLFQAGQLPTTKGTARRIDTWVEGDSGRLDAGSRRKLYSHVLGRPSVGDVEPNRNFEPLFARLLAAVSASQRSRATPKRPSASPEAVRRAARDLALDLSNRSYGAPVQIAPALAARIELGQAILADPKIRSKYGAKNTWQLVRIVAKEELGVHVRPGKLRRQADAGALVIDWLAGLSVPLSSHGGAAEEDLAPADRRIPQAVRTLERLLDFERMPSAKTTAPADAKIRPLCFDAKQHLVPCTVDDDDD